MSSVIFGPEGRELVEKKVSGNRFAPKKRNVCGIVVSDLDKSGGE